MTAAPRDAARPLPEPDPTHRRPGLARAALALVFAAGAWSCALAHDAHPAASIAGIDPGLGPVHHPVSTRSAEAQAWFDQGLRLVYAFNHEAAVRSFERAFALDPDLAMAQWGIAYALGPNINVPMEPAAHKAAYAAVQKAVALKRKASPAERDYIDALAKRYSENPEADLAPLQAAYREAMKQVVRRHPADNDAAVLYAESIMDLAPWRYWLPDGAPAEGTLEVVAVLEGVLARDPSHTGANHYYIHAVEASAHPERALASAKRLETLAPSAGHLVHMPAHTYIRTGRYLDAARANIAAAKADERLAAANPDVAPMYLVGYYGHNLHFLAVANAFAGRSKDALDAANKLYAVQLPRIKEIPFVDAFLMTPALIACQFGRWDDVLALPEPPFEASITLAMWHLARTLALAGKGRADEARAEREKFLAAAATLSATMGYGNNNAALLAAVARPYLDGSLALLDGRTAAAITYLRQAVAAEDALAYDEPPGWYLPSRDLLGDALLRAGDMPAAEQTFRDELAVHPESGRALHGLQASLQGQGRASEAAAVGQRFRQAWRDADVTL